LRLHLPFGVPNPEKPSLLNAPWLKQFIGLLKAPKCNLTTQFACGLLPALVAWTR